MSAETGRETIRADLSGLWAALDVAVLQKDRDGAFRLAGKLPDWFKEFSPQAAAGHAIRIEEIFLYVGHFLHDARALWARRTPGSLDSGPWTETTPDGEEWPLEATATHHDGLDLLLIRVLGPEFEELRRVLQMAREQALHFQSLARAAQTLGAASWQRQGAVTAGDDSLVRMKADGTYLDYSPGEEADTRREAKSIYDALPRHLADELATRVSAVVAAGQAQSFEYVVEEEGIQKELEARLAPCGVGEVLIVTRDVTQTKRAERELAERLAAIKSSHDDLSLLLNNIDLGALITDAAGCVVFLNEAAKRLLGSGSEAAAGCHWRELPLFAGDRGESLERLSAAGRRPRERASIRWERDDGREFWMEASLDDDPRQSGRRILFLYDVSEVQDLRRRLADQSVFEGIVGRSEPMQRVYHQIDDFAAYDTTVLIEGETGTGKELVARALYAKSPRSNGPFIAVNCAGLTESLATSQLFGHKRGSFTGAVSDSRGLFEAANGGVLFLDEIGDVPPVVQTAMLRVLQEKEITRVGDTSPRKIDVRVVAATHRDLDHEVSKGSFRQDLLYRIRVARIPLPPLRERVGDIPLLASRFLAEFRASTGKAIERVGSDCMRLFAAYAWPGNVRELRSALEYGAIRSRGEAIGAADLPPEIAAGAGRLEAEEPEPIEGIDEKERIRDALRKAGGNRSRAARLLGIGRATLYRRMAAFGVDGE